MPLEAEMCRRFLKRINFIKPTNRTVRGNQQDLWVSFLWAEPSSGHFFKLVVTAEEKTLNIGWKKAIVAAMA